MKKLSKLFVISAAITVISAAPVMAAEITDPATITTEAQLIATLAAHQDVVATQVKAITDSMADKGAAAQQAAMALNEVSRYNRAEADNYINYLNKAIINLKETERIKQEVVNNYTNLATVNPTYAAMIPQAMAEYNKAVADRQQWEANLAKAVADFSAMYPR